MRIGITLPSRTGSLESIFEFARAADAAGFDSAWDYEVYRNPFTMLAGAALRTERIALATGLAAAFSRSPFEAANAAADVDELSGGRMLFGLGTGVPEFLSAFHSTDARAPLGRMREYIHVLRASWQYLGTGQSEEFAGKHYSFTPPPINPWGDRSLARPEIPVYLGAMGPKMLELAGEVADGWLGYFATDRLIDEYIRPQVALGAARAGRDLSEIELAAMQICCVHPDRDVALRRAKLQVGFYVVHPVSDRVAKLHGLEDQVNELRQRMMSEGLAAFAHTDERLVEAFSITGTPEEARQRVTALDGVVDHLALHTPYVPPFDAEESADAFAQIVDAFKDFSLNTAGSPEPVGGRTSG